MPGTRHSHLIAFLVGALGIASFSIMDAVMKGLVLAIGTYVTLLWRSFAGIAMSGALYATRHERWPSRSTMKIHVARGVLTTLMSFLFFWALGRVPLAQAIALAFIAPLIALYLAAAWLHEKIGPRTLGASLVAFAGVVVIFVGQARADLGGEALLGSLAVLASAVCYAVNIIMMRRQSLVAGPTEVAFFQNLTVGAVLLSVLPFVGTSVPPVDQWGWIVLAALLSTLSLLLLSWAYARAEASYLAATEYTSFLWAAALGWTVFGERLSPFTLAGAALIVVGCIVAARTPTKAGPALEVAA